VKLRVIQRAASRLCLRRINDVPPPRLPELETSSLPVVGDRRGDCCGEAAKGDRGS